MASIFDRLLRDVVEPNLDAAFAEQTRFEPMKSGQYGSGLADPSRMIRDGLRGVVDRSPEGDQLDGDVPGDRTFRARVAFERVTVSYDVSLFLSKDDWPRQNDRIVLTDQEGTPCYLVERDAQLSGSSRIDVALLREPPAMRSP